MKRWRQSLAHTNQPDTLFLPLDERSNITMCKKKKKSKQIRTQRAGDYWDRIAQTERTETMCSRRVRKAHRRTSGSHACGQLGKTHARKHRHTPRLGGRKASWMCQCHPLIYTNYAHWPLSAAPPCNCINSGGTVDAFTDAPDFPLTPDKPRGWARKRSVRIVARGDADAFSLVPNFVAEQLR